jgi:hypothetical protein
LTTQLRQAYAELDTTDVHLSRLTPNGTRISYLDKDFLEENFEGLVKCEIQSATLVGDNQWWNPFSLDAFKGDPYVIASIDGAVAKTETIWGNSSPEFSSTFYFYVKNKQSGRILVRLMDDNVALVDNEVGKALIPTASLADGERKEFQLKMGPSGSLIDCAVTYVSLADNQRVEELALASEDVKTLFASSSALLASQWRALHANGDPKDLFLPLAFVENCESDTQAWIFLAKEKKHACVAFRGTEQSEWKDILSDLNLVPTNISYDEGRIEISSSTVDDESIWVHRGFLDAYCSVAAEIREILLQVIGGTSPGQWTVFTTGHSLGGALSTLAAFELAAKSKESGTFREVRNYSFGSPMVGNGAFCEAFNDLVPSCIRFANIKDAVTFVPRLIGYSHVGTKCTLSESGFAVFEDDKGVGEDVNVENVLTKMTQAKLKELAAQGFEAELEALDRWTPGWDLMADDGSDIDIDKIIEAEKDALTAIIEGDAVEEHLEPAYFSRLMTLLRSCRK